MAGAGWYDDPGGAPGQVRYFDGEAWTAELRPAPGASTSPTLPARPGWLWVVLVIAGLILALLVWVLFRPGGGLGPTPEDSSTPTVSAWDETSTPTPTPTEDGRPVDCPPDTRELSPGQPREGRFHGGGLSYPEIPHWENSGGWGLDWASDRAGQRQGVTPTWYAATVVGEVDSALFPDVTSAARQLLECKTSSYYYEGFQSRRDLMNQAITLDGKPGWKLVSEVRVGGRDDGMTGDHVTIIVVDVGRQNRLAVFSGEAPLGDAERNQLVNTTVDGLRVEG